MSKLFANSRPLFFDGGLGTQLQTAGLAPGQKPAIWNLTHPDSILELHKEYLAAGAQVITANTFGANRIHFPHGGNFALEDIIAAGIAHARACAAGKSDALVAMDVGPTGKLLAPLGTFAFEDAVAVFREAGALGAQAGADLFLVETMSDPLELKAAVLGLQEAAPQLPVICCFTLEENGRMLTGAAPAAAAVMAEGLGAAAVGINCGTGPQQIQAVLPELLAAVRLPIVAIPNAGLPVMQDGATHFSLQPESFAAEMAQLYAMGAAGLGGCCGTAPAHIRAMVQAVSRQTIAPKPTASVRLPAICSATDIVRFGARAVVIGERINPTGKPTFQKHLRAGNWDYLLDEAISQAEAGADVLDINVGLPGIDEKQAMLEAVARVRQAVSLPLQIDSADPAVMEAALRSYPGKALINSVNGKQESMDAVFPLAKKYGGVVVALLLDEDGIPETVQGRLAIAEKIYNRAAQYGIARSEILIDTLTMAVSAAPDAAAVTLETLEHIRAMGGYTILGVSNISFGLPQRALVNAAFLTMALQKGLSAAILNPKSTAMMGALRSANLLQGKDGNCEAFLAFAETVPAPSAASPAPPKSEAAASGTLFEAILFGRKEAAVRLASQELAAKPPLVLIQSAVIPALDEAGIRFGDGRMFLPQLLQCAAAAKAALALLQEEMQRSGGTQASRGTVVLATVHGDIHDIGKNIVKTMLETYHFTVIDLGKDVPPQAVADAVLQHSAPVCGLSALMTTTVPAMEATIQLLRRQAPGCKIMAGGAVLTQAYADQIGADAWCPDAMSAVKAAEKFIACGGKEL